MSELKTDKLDSRVLILLPTGRDAALVAATLEKAGIESCVCADAEDLRRDVQEGAGAAIMAEEALQNGAVTGLFETFSKQPIWSDIPVILFSSSTENAERLLTDMSSRLNATIVERPIRIAMLVSAVRGALRARQRQYQTRDLLTQLKQSDKQKDLFLATLSHELRTPLNSILGWIQLLRGKPSKMTDAAHALDVIERNAKAQSEIISDILFVSRIVTGKLELKSEPVDLASVVNAAADVIRPSVDAKRINLEISIQAGQTLIVGDADRLQQVFLNLLSNAVKFTSESGRIVIRITRKDEDVEVSVADTGRGISPKFLPYVFERFRQADNTYTRRVGGLGLGLAIVRHLVELHGGKVSAHSAGKGRGATFVVSFPSLAPDAAGISADLQKPKEKPRVDHDGLRGLRLMIVEDDADSREMLSTLLESQGVEVAAVDSAAAALENISVVKPDILISDVGLPGQNGYDLMRMIRSLPADRGGRTPAIALTGYVSTQDRKLALSAGFQEHLAKPIEVEELVKLIKQLAPLAAPE